MWSGDEEIKKAMYKIKNSMDLSEPQEDIIFFSLQEAVNNAHWAGRDWTRDRFLEMDSNG